MNSKIKCCGVAVAVLGCCSVWAGMHYLRPDVGDWTLDENYWDNAAPSANDQVYNCSTATNYVTYGTPSWNVFQSLSYVLFETDAGTLVINVPKGVCATNVVPLGRSSSAENYVNCGTVVKRGEGSLTFYNTNKSVYAGISCAFLTKHLRIEEGDLYMPQDVILQYRLGEVYVADGATFHLGRMAEEATSRPQRATTYLGALSGSGMVTNSATYALPLSFDRVFTNEFAGVIGGGVQVTVAAADAQFNIKGANSTFSDASVYPVGMKIEGDNVILGLEKFGRRTESYPGEASSSGYAYRYLASGTNVTLKNLATADQTFSKTLIVQYSPLTIDAGSYGGITFNGVMSGYYGSQTEVSRMQHLILSGDNVEPCIFSPYIACWSMAVTPETNCTFYITKRGAGTYFFNGIGVIGSDVSDWRGGLAVENGTVQFDAVGEAGVNGPLGKATMLQEPYCGVPDASHDVDYAISLGGNGTMGTLQYCGAEKAVTTTRPIAVYSDGALVNNAASVPLCWRSIFARTDGPSVKTFRLGGTSMASNIVEDVTGRMSLVKEGSGTWTLAGNTSFDGDLTVTGGKLIVQSAANYSYYKWVCMQVYGQEADGSAYVGKDYGIRIQEFALFDGNGIRVNVGLAQAGSEALIGEGEAAWVEAGRGYTFSPADHSDQIDLMFNDSVDTKWMVMPQAAVKLSDSRTWISLVMHLTNGTPTVASYDFCSIGWDPGYHPTRWKFYGSLNGMIWHELDDRTSTEQPIPWYRYGYYGPAWNTPNGSGEYEEYVAGSASIPHTTGYQVNSAISSSALSNVKDVRVAAGARLVADGNVVLRRLTVDMTDGGDVTGFTIADSGRLDIIHQASRMQTFTLPGDFSGCIDLGNFAKWDVTVDGIPIDSSRITVRNGRLTVMAIGFRCIIR